MREFHLEIATPDGVEYCGTVESVLVKTSDGDVEILYGHTDLVASVATGRVRIKKGGTERLASAAGGILSVTQNEVKIAATTFEFADKIDVRRAERSKERAEQMLRAAKSDAEISKAEARLSRALNRIKVANM